jgi:hypothetical protein
MSKHRLFALESWNSFKSTVLMPEAKNKCNKTKVILKFNAVPKKK